MILHDRFSFECGGYVDIKRRPIQQMSELGKKEFILALKYIRDRMELIYLQQQADRQLEALLLKQE